jgi:DNA topoisomerase-1
MVVRVSRHGKFLGCSGYPKCRTIRRIEGAEKTGIPCPRAGCGGELVMKRTKARRIFYGCNRYPDCEFALWGKPTGEKCPECQSLMMEKLNRAGESQIVCSNPECGFEAPM